MKQAALAAFLALAGCSFREGFLAPAGPVAAGQADHLRFVVLVMVLVVLPLFMALPVILWRYRRRGGGGAFVPDWDFNRLLEWLVWGVPAIAVVLLGINLWQGARGLDPYKPLGPDPLQVRLVTLDWKFLILYPEQGIATVNLLVLPVDRPVQIELTSGTVMQSVLVPRLGGQIYAMAGMRTQLNLAASEAGEFRGLNTQYNGNGFAGQSFRVKATGEADFSAWVEQVRSGGEALDWAGYETLAKPSEVSDAVLYSSYEAGLFDRVMGQFAPAMTGGGS